MQEDNEIKASLCYIARIYLHQKNQPPKSKQIKEGRKRKRESQCLLSLIEKLNAVYSNNFYLNSL